jgi:spore photoproduct lyase
MKGDENIVVGWSLNPQKIIDSNEFYATSLAERIEAARRIVEAGYRVAFHFDPVFYYDGWEDDYREVIEKISGVIDSVKIAWISLGTLRFNPALKKIIEARFPGNDILNAEMVLGFDDKLRYPDRLRYLIYRFLIDALTEYSRTLPIYLCMEERSMWEELKLPFPFGRLTVDGGPGN